MKSQWKKKGVMYILSFAMLFGNMTFLTPYESAQAAVNLNADEREGDESYSEGGTQSLQEDYTPDVTDPAEPAGASPAEAPNLLITELVPDTSNYASYDAFEFIEVFNTGDAGVDLKGYRILSDKWEKVIDSPFIIRARESAVFWTRRAEIEPLTWEAFNSYYFTSYASKYIPQERTGIIANVGGLVNSGTQVVILQDSSGNEVVRAQYTGAEVAEGKSIIFSYPEEGSKNMKPMAVKQRPTPGWIIEGQEPPREKDEQVPVQPTGLQAEKGDGTVKLTWNPNSEPDMERYNIYKDDSLEFSVPADQTMFEVYGLTGNVAYNFEVTGVDRSGQESPKSESEQVTVKPSHQKVTQTERTQNPYNSKYQTLWDISEDGPVIPGLKQDLVPQGLGYYPEKNWILAVNYMDDGRPGTLSVLNEASGELLKSVILMNEDGTPYTGHAGGVAVSPGYVWIASEEYLYQIKLMDLIDAEDNDEIQFIDTVPVPVQASFNYYADGVLWVGEFYEKTSYPTDPSHHMTNRTGETYYAWMAGYTLDQTTGSISSEDWSTGSATPATPDMVLSIPGKVQGAVVREDGVILSTSWGRGNDSLLYWYNNQLQESAHSAANINGREVPVWFLDAQAEKQHNSRLNIVPMSEGIVDVGGELYVQLESGATKYRYTTTYIMDRMIKINLNRWAKYGLEEEPPIEPESPEVLISQYMYDVPGTDDGAEYIVIKNYADKQVDISGFMIGDGINQSKGEGMAAFPPGTVMNPGQEMVLAQSGIRFKQIYGTVPDFEMPWIGVIRTVDDPDIPDLLPTDWSTGIIQLANGGDEILLMDPQTNIVDFVPYIIDRTYREVAYKAVSATAPGDGNAIHRIGRTGNLPVDFAAGPPSLGDRPIPIPISNSLLITEVIYDPLFDEVLGEFVEITNISDKPVDISGYYLGDEESEGQASPEGMFNFPEGTVIQPYEVFVIARNAKGVEDLYGKKPRFELEQSDPSVAKMVPNCTWGCGTMQLANTGDEVLLLDRNKKLIDAIIYKSGMFMGMEAHRGVNSGHSLERLKSTDTKNSAADFVDQPRPTPGILLFGPNGREDLIPVSDLKDDVLLVNEPESAMAAAPTVIDASSGMPDELPGNIPSFLMKARLSGGKLYADNRGVLLSEALDRIQGTMLPVIEINESRMVQPLHQLLSARGITDVLIVSTNPDLVKQIRGLNDEYRGAVRFEDSKLNKKDIQEIVRTVRRSTGLIALIDQEALTKEHVRSLFIRSVSVWGYGVTTEAEAHRLISMGVSGIESSDTSVITSAFAKFDATDSITQHPIIVAHRGMSALAPENTMPAFELAVEKGAEVIELDILESKDGELVLIHDYTVDRTTNGKGKVSELTLEQLKSLTANKTNNPDWQKEYDKYPDAKIPTLKEVLTFAKGKNVVLALEMKGFGYEDKVIDLVEKYHMESDVYVTSFSQDVLERVKQENPEIGRGFTLDGGKPSPEEALQDAEKVVTDHIQLGTFYFANYSMLTPEFISYAKHRGLPVIAWTVNSKQGMQDAISMGITGIITDYAHWMDQVAVSISGAKNSYTLKVGQTLTLKDLKASVHFRAGKPAPFAGEIRVIGPDGVVAPLDPGNKGLKALKPGIVTLQLYQDYKPFSIPVDGDPAILDNTWRMYSEPVMITVK
ncbi:glycerophosphodiester phosphodiesterase family protein [Paenibacillus dakarensis]|uniref:glycerophosphodiester phosphodiesterase family protein n=1 Tax=Paenibacillus dakarensis TaxID=1527293 RepID=UPI0006D572CF|nr:glycerophosphodiester phosphodiesterase family protein [Paenibacillus dakarensis]